MSTSPPAAFDAAALNAYLAQVFPQNNTAVLAVGYGTARTRLATDERTLRPGGTVWGPAMFAVADNALYCAVLGAIGPVPLAVTTDMTIHFLRKPAAGALIADARLIKLGKRLAIGEVHVYSEGDPDPAAHVVGTYSIPPR